MFSNCPIALDLYKRIVTSEFYKSLILAFNGKIQRYVEARVEGGGLDETTPEYKY